MRQIRFYSSLTLTLSSIIVLGGLACAIAVPGGLHFLETLALGHAADRAAAADLSLAWLAAAVVAAAVVFHRNPSLLPGAAGDGSAEAEDKTLQPTIDLTPRPVYADAAPPNPEAFNMFDPADLPPRLSEYANLVYSACEDLGNFFGFQDSSVRNQAEHLLVLLSNNRRYLNSHVLPPALQPPSPIHALHAKVFSNYVKWCRYQGVAPHFSRAAAAAMAAGMAAPPSVASRVVDLVLFFCVWGEACNIRHMPECLWFLYHKMMEEYVVKGAPPMEQTLADQPRSLYAGHFLDYVVMPIFNIVSTVSHDSAESQGSH